MALVVTKSQGHTALQSSVLTFNKMNFPSRIFGDVEGVIVIAREISISGVVDSALFFSGILLKLSTSSTTKRLLVSCFLLNFGRARYSVTQP